MKKLILIDGFSLLFRSYFAMRPMVTSQGIHTQGLFAFVNMLNKIIKDYEPDYIAVAFDMKEKTFRHEQYEDYKAGRQQAPVELLTEIPWLHRILEAMNIAVLEMPRYEADDIIGTLSVHASEDGIRTLCRRARSVGSCRKDNSRTVGGRSCGSWIQCCTNVVDIATLLLAAEVVLLLVLIVKRFPYHREHIVEIFADGVGLGRL